MKRTHIVLGALMLTLAVIGFSSFAGKTRTVVTYYFTNSSHVATAIDNASNWSTTPQTCSELPSNVCAISFDNSVLTLQQALDQIENGYPFTQGETFDSGLITITDLKH